MDFDMENFDKLRLENERLRKKVRELESARPEALRRQVCFGIFDSEGKMHVSENCISDCSAVLADELHYLQRDEPDDGWHIAPMFIETTPSPLAPNPAGVVGPPDDLCGKHDALSGREPQGERSNEP